MSTNILERGLLLHIARKGQDGKYVFDYGRIQEVFDQRIVIKLKHLDCLVSVNKNEIEEYSEKPFTKEVEYFLLTKDGRTIYATEDFSIMVPRQTEDEKRQEEENKNRANMKPKWMRHIATWFFAMIVVIGVLGFSAFVVLGIRALVG